MRYQILHTYNHTCLISCSVQSTTGMWDGHIKMEDTHGHVRVELFPNGSFVTHDYQRFTDAGINTDGVLRGEIG